MLKEFEASFAVPEPRTQGQSFVSGGKIVVDDRGQYYFRYAFLLLDRFPGSL